MAKKQFKAESKRLLELMIHSIYTNKEIFLRELISNASDASDKRYFNSIQNGETGISRDALAITLAFDKEGRTLTITDHGCGMTREELEENLGTIAHSGSLEFKQTNQKAEDIDIIGQFGVGFYSAFMVADKVTVKTKTVDGEAFCWESTGADGYTIFACEKTDVGTEITLHLKEDSEEESYSDYLSEYLLKSLVKKYSDYIRYPIKMEISSTRMKEGSAEDTPEWEESREVKTLNSMTPIWKKSKSEVTPEDYNEFFKARFYEYEDPLKVIHSSTEGAATYDALLFIPAKAPYNFYHKDYQKGLALYASGVLIMEHCADLLPDHFAFVRGVVDSQDLSLNISRELLQHDRQLKVIASRLEKKIQSELLSMRNNDREKYETFFKAFGLQLKFGVYSSFGANNELLQDLLLFESSFAQKPTTLEEYVSRMKEEQSVIYYACGESAAKLSHLPQSERLLAKGYEILYLTDDVDEFAIKMLRSYKDKKFANVSDSAVDQTEEEKQQIEQKTQESSELLTFVKETLGDKVSDVALTARLQSFPVCLSASGELSLEMEKVLNAMPNDQKVKAQRVLELNFEHPVFQKLSELYQTDSDKAKSYVSLLYQQALLIEGFPLANPVEFANEICKLMV